VATRLTLTVSIALCACAAGVSFYALSRSHALVDRERTARQAQVARLERQLDALRGSSAALSGRVDTAVKRLHRKEAGIAPLASRVLRSVFTVRTPYGL
jgi:hypothetical protein